MIKVTTSIFLVFSIASCAAHRELEPRFAPTALRGEKIENINKCIPAIEVVDARVRSSTNLKNITPKKAVSWVEGAIKYISTKTSVIESSESAPTITLGLEKAYITHLATSKSGVVVISASQNSLKKYFRARLTGINWWGTNTEYHSILNKALEKAILDFTKDGDFEIGCALSV